MPDQPSPAYIDLGTFVHGLMSELSEIKREISRQSVIAAKTEVALTDIANITATLKREIYGNGNEGMKTKVEVHDRIAGTVNKLLLAAFGQMTALAMLSWNVWRTS